MSADRPEYSGGTPSQPVNNQGTGNPSLPTSSQAPGFYPGASNVNPYSNPSQGQLVPGGAIGNNASSNYPSPQYGANGSRGSHTPPAQPGANSFNPYPNQAASGSSYPNSYPNYVPAGNPVGGAGIASGVSDKSSVAAGLLQFFLGGVGAGNFYAGKTILGVIQLILWLVAWPLYLAFLLGALIHVGLWIWNLIESVMYWTKSGSYAYDGNGLRLQ